MRNSKSANITLCSFFLLLSFLLPRAAQAEITGFVGAGPALSFPGTIRIGYNSWEAGLLTTTSYGVDEIFRVNWKYVAWGLALNGVGTWGLGFYGAAGIEPKLFWGLTFRAELDAVAASNGFVKGEAYAGLGIHF